MLQQIDWTVLGGLCSCVQGGSDRQSTRTCLCPCATRLDIDKQMIDCLTLLIYCTNALPTSQSLLLFFFCCSFLLEIFLSQMCAHKLSFTSEAKEAVSEDKEDDVLLLLLFCLVKIKIFQVHCSSSGVLAEVYRRVFFDYTTKIFFIFYIYFFNYISHFSQNSMLHFLQFINF